MKPLDVAIRYIGDHEISKNHSPAIKTFWPDTNYPDGYDNREPYCAAFVCHCLAQAAREGWVHQVKTLPQEAAVRYFLEWCVGRLGVKVFKPGDDTPQAGDIAIFLPHLSHMGFVVSSNKSTNSIVTLEANTGATGGREGDGIYIKSRGVTFAGSYVRFL